MCPRVTEGGITRQTQTTTDDGLTSGGRRESRTQERWMGTTERVSAAEPGGEAPMGERETEAGESERGRGNASEQALSRHFIGGRSPVGRKPSAARSSFRPKGDCLPQCLHG